METRYDVAVLGAGPGGYVAAIRASQLGLKPVVIEKAEPGGVCLNWGCIPSKAIINQAKIFNSGAILEAMGVKLDKSGFNYNTVYEKSRAAADRLSQGVAFLLKKNKVDVLKGEGKLLAPGKIGVGKEEVEASNIIIATGSSPRSIPGFEIDEESILSSTGILKLKTVPKSIIILGAGAIGLEFAYVLSSFGTRVTLVEMLDSLFPPGDAEVSTALKRVFDKRKVESFLGAKATDCQPKKGQLSITIEQDGKSHTLQAEKLLVAVGRKPNTEGLGLESLGIKTEKGFIVTGDYYQTTVKGVYAIGDVINTPLLAHVASKEGEIAVEHMAGKNPEKRIKADEIPYGVYCEPQIGGFGLTEKDAAAAGREFGKAVFPYRGAGKAVAVDEVEGFVKIIYDKKTKEILGAHILGAEATELIHEILLAKKSELLLEDIAAMIHAHPTLSEAVMEAARLGEGWAIHI
ncbi:MAG: dihydrolipoyl dehydrogenase [Spirochaetales bacterium]|nr:dihydrolipoyl dehydrogenase [Spirochaetales bacterium]